MRRRRIAQLLGGRSPSAVPIATLLRTAERNAESRLSAAKRDAESRLSAAKCDAESRLRKQEDLYQLLLKEKDTRLEEKDARLEEKDAHLMKMDTFLKEKDTRLEEKVLAHASALAVALHDADVARAVVTSRVLFDNSLDTLWKQAHAELQLPPPANVGVSKRAEVLLRSPSAGGKFPGLGHALAVAAEDNDVPPSEVLMQARRLYEILSARVHSVELRGTARLPEDVFEAAGRPAMVAFAGIVRAAGRTLSLYRLGDGEVRLRLRVPVPCSATLEAARAAPLMPEVRV